MEPIWNDKDSFSLGEGWTSDEQLEARRARTDDPNRGQVLPLYKNEDGSVDFALPQWALDAYNSLTLPRDTIMADIEPTSEDVINFAGMIGLGGSTASAALSPDADVGMFLGKNAMSADQEALMRAADMKTQGLPREKIWEETGWWEAPDGNWVWEIDDSKFDLTPAVYSVLDDPAMKGVEGSTRRVLDHPQLFDEYGYENEKVEPLADPYKEDDGFDPTTNSTRWRDIDPKVAVGKREKNYEGKFWPSIKRIHVEGEDVEVIKDTLVHELQHAVQLAEGMEGGSSTEVVEDMQARIAQSLPSVVNDYWKVESTFREIFEKDLTVTDAYADRLIKSKLDFEEKFGPELTSQIHEVINLVNAPAYEMYRNNAGELLAEASARRRNLNAEGRKKLYPWLHMSEDEEAAAWTPKTIATKVSGLLKSLVESGLE